MTDSSNLSRRDFERRIYDELDMRLRVSAFSSGASEAHGLLVGLGCRGIHDHDLEDKLGLFRLSDDQELALIQGLYGLVEKDLNSGGMEFQLLLPDDDISMFERTEAVTDWCQGFIQGICHDGEDILDTLPAEARESIEDIIEISHAEVSEENDENERALFEITEFLRVASQLVFEELNPVSNQSAQQKCDHHEH